MVNPRFHHFFGGLLIPAPRHVAWTQFAAFRISNRCIDNRNGRSSVLRGFSASDRGGGAGGDDDILAGGYELCGDLRILGCVAIRRHIFYADVVGIGRGSRDDIPVCSERVFKRLDIFFPDRFVGCDQEADFKSRHVVPPKLMKETRQAMRRLPVEMVALRRRGVSSKSHRATGPKRSRLEQSSKNFWIGTRCPRRVNRYICPQLGCPVCTRKRSNSGRAGRSEKCHVWTAPSWQELSSRKQHRSVQPCVRPIDAVHMTAGHNALRGSGPGQ